MNHNIDWDLLAKQKAYLVDLAFNVTEDSSTAEVLAGIIHLLDALQDEHEHGAPDRLYTLALTDMGCEQEEHTSQLERDKFLSQKSSMEEDWYCLDVRHDGGVDFYLAATGDDVELPDEVEVTEDLNILVKGVEYVAEVSDGSCHGCVLEGESLRLCDPAPCMPSARPSGESVIFVKPRTP